MGNGTNFAGITFNSGASSFTLVGNPIVLAGGITNSSTAVQTISFAITNTTGGRPLVTTAGGGNVTINGGLYGSGGSFSISGGGTVTIGGVNNTQTGTTTVTNSALVLAATNALPIAQLSLLGSAGAAACYLDLNGFNQVLSGASALVGTDANNETATGCYVTNSSATLATLMLTNIGNNYQFREGNIGGNLKLVINANSLNGSSTAAGYGFQGQVAGNTYSGGTLVQGVGTVPLSTTNLAAVGDFIVSGVGNCTNTAAFRFYGNSDYYLSGGLAFGTGPITLDNGELWSAGYAYYVTNPISVTSRGGILRSENNGLQWRGAISGTGMLAVIVAPSSTANMNFSNDLSGFTGTLAVNTGSGCGVGTVNIGYNSPACNLLFWGNGSKTGVVQWNGSTASPVTLTFNEVNCGVNGGATAVGKLSSGNAATVTYQLGDNTATTNNFGGIVQNGSGAVGITKIGSDTQILSGVNTYTNPTYVGGGTLTLPGVNNGQGGYVVSNSATLSLGGSGSLTNSSATVTVLAGGTLVSGGASIGGLVTLGSGNATINLQDNIINTNILAGGLTLNSGNVLNFDIGGASDVIAITGGTYTKNAGTVTVNVAGTGFGVGTYPLITGAGITSTNGFTLGTVPSNPSFSYVLTVGSGNSLSLQAALAVVVPSTAFWKGGVNNNWSTADSLPNFNWASNSAATGSTGAKPGVTTAVTFSTTTGAANQSTILGGNFEINSLTLTTTANVGIGGANTLQLDSGGMTINSGAGNLTISNSSLVVGGSQLWTNNSANTVTVSAPISGLSTVTLGGGNTVWSGANSHSGTTVTAGKLALTGSGSLGSSSASVSAAGGNIDLGGSSQSVGSVQVINGSTITNGTITGTSYDLQSGTIAAVMGGGVVNAVKSTTGTVVLPMNNTFAGNMIVGNGTLQIGAGGVTGSLNEGSMVVSNGAALVFNSSGTQTNGGVISGSGPINIVGGGSVTLNNTANSFSGNILVDGSTLVSANSANTFNATVGVLGNPSVARAITLTNGANLTLLSGNTFGGWSSTRCGVAININLGCQFALNVINPPNSGDSNPLGDLRFNGGKMLVGNGWAALNQCAILISNVYVDGTSPSAIVTTGSDATKNGVMLGSAGTDANSDVLNKAVHFVVNSTGSSSADLTVSARLVDPPYAGSVGGPNTNSNGGLYKDGSGTMLLTSANTYTGPTIVNAGKLVVSSVQGTAGMTNYIDVLDGATLGVLVSGTNQWSPSLAYLGTGGAGISLEFTSLQNTNIAPFNPASVSVPGSVTVNVYGALAVGQYRLIANAAGSIGSFSLNTLPPGVVASLTTDTDGTTIDLNVTTGSATFVWTGQTDTNWDIATSNWKTNGTATIYQDLVPVQFDDTAIQGKVNLAVAVTPANVIVTNSAVHYTISSASNAITGSTSLTKSGNGILTLTNLNNSFSGGTVINAGTVEVSGNANLGSGPVRLSGGTLSVLQTYSNSLALTVGPTSGSGTGTIGVAAGQSLSIPNIITDTTGGSGTLIKSGAGTLTFSATNGYSGGTLVGNGTLVLNANAGSGAGAVHGSLTINPGATVQTTIQDAIGFAANVSASPINIIGGTLTNSSGANEGYITTFNLTGGTMSSSGGAYNFNGTNAAINSLATNIVSTISGPVQLRADGLTINTAQGTVPSGVDLLISGNITALGNNVWGITKAGTGLLQLTGTNTYIGNTIINGGTLELAQSFATLGTNSNVIITNSAHLKLTVAGVTNKVTGLSLNGAAQPNGYYNSGNSSGYITGAGVLQVGTITGPTAPGSITNSISGSTLTLTWPAGQGWRLVSQTNSLSVGLTTNGWNTVSGGIDGSNSITIDPTKPTVFYRLTYP